jgi:hypothetical protein
MKKIIISAFIPVLFLVGCVAPVDQQTQEGAPTLEQAERPTGQSASQDTQEPSDGLNPPVDGASQEACAQQGGQWKEFPNSCVDSCVYNRTPEVVSCLMAITNGCDCGPEQCWDQATNSCVALY